MASQEPKYSSEFKAKVALEALAQNKMNLDRLSDKYDVPVSVILMWTVQLERNAGRVYVSSTPPSDMEVQDKTSEEESIVDVEISDPDISESIGFGAMHDDLDYKTLFYWSALALVFIILFAQLVKITYETAVPLHEEEIDSQAVYEVNIQKQEATKQISTFGVVNLDEGIFKIPIDTVMNQMAAESDSTANEQ